MKLYTHEFRTPVGRFRLKATPKGLSSLEFPVRKKSPRQRREVPPEILSLLKKAGREICLYLRGKRTHFKGLAVDWSRYRPFERRVLRELQKVPWGKQESYQFLARKIGRPQAARAVGQALHSNPLPLILPCHRIVRKNGAVGGFSKGARWKNWLLKLEERRVDTIFGEESR